MKSSILQSLFFIGSLWLFFGVQALLPITGYGILPRDLVGLIGIAASPLLHGDLWHLVANSVGLITLAPFFFIVTRNQRYILFEIWGLAGLFTWLIGRPDSLHIGASSVIFGMIGFLGGLGLFDRRLKSILISAVALFLYGGALWGLLPSNPSVSWEGHLGGFIAGLICAKYSFQGAKLITRR